MMTQEQTGWLTRAEARDLAGISDSTLRNAVYRGEIKYKGIRGNQKLFRREDVERWIRERGERRQQVQRLDED